MSFLPAFVVIASVFIPTAVAIGLFWGYRKWQDRDGRRSPIENRAIYGAGEQLRRRVEEHTDEIMLGLTMLFFLGPFFIAVWALQRVNWSTARFGVWNYVLVAVFSLMVVSAIGRIFKHGKQRRMANAGLQAEIFTAQELNRLMALGCTVLHDLPADGFNIDHIVIGPRAVYAVETKSVRKPSSNQGHDHFKVRYDGHLLRFPDFIDSKRLKQTKRQADWLARYLQQAVGRPIPVVPALALPGWWIDNSDSNVTSDIRVFNPSGRGANFMADAGTGSQLDRGAMALVTQALVMRYPVEVAGRK